MGHILKLIASLVKHSGHAYELVMVLMAYLSPEHLREIGEKCLALGRSGQDLVEEVLSPTADEPAAATVEAVADVPVDHPVETPVAPAPQEPVKKRWTPPGAKKTA